MPSGPIAPRCRRSSSPCDGCRPTASSPLMVSRSGSPRGHLAGFHRLVEHGHGAWVRVRGLDASSIRDLGVVDGRRSPLVSSRRSDSSPHRGEPAPRHRDLRRDHPRRPSRAVRPAAARRRPTSARWCARGSTVALRRRDGWSGRRRCSASRAAWRSPAGSPSSARCSCRSRERWRRTCSRSAEPRRTGSSPFRTRWSRLRHITRSVRHTAPSSTSAPRCSSPTRRPRSATGSPPLAASTRSSPPT